MLKDIISRNRSYRRFEPGVAVPRKTLEDMVELARLSASTANLQPLKYHLSCDIETNEKVFQTLLWAGYLSDWDRPVDEEKPTAYITILGDTNIASKFDVDSGIAAQSILLGAVEKGLGGCIFGSIKHEELRKNLALPEHLTPLLVIALGKPREQVVLETAEDGQIRYYRSADGTHHVPKRPLEELLIN